MNKSFAYDAARAYGHTQALCYPRRVGTPRERRAAGYILQQFAALNLTCQREPFSASHFPAEFGSRLLYAASALLIVAAALEVATRPLLAALCWGLAGVLLNAPWRQSGFVGNRWPPRVHSENLLAGLPRPEAPPPARVVFMAHYDTKSQLLPAGLRIALVCAATALCGLLALLGVAAAAGFPEVFQAVSPLPLSLAGVALLIGLVANVTGNRSPGALDNGSSVGALLELAHSWRPQPAAPVEVLWVASGAEEIGLDGARHFLGLHQAWWREKPTLLINLESVGAGPRTFLAGEAQALRLAREVADELGLRHARLRILGAGMDHEPFVARHLQAVSILGDVVRKSFAMHSARDNMALIELPALERAGQLAGQLAWRWAELHQPAVRVPSLAADLPQDILVNRSAALGSIG